jgi:gamma-glutamyl:cysteine ligase YbdK (ATP-grasp superfamily)
MKRTFGVEREAFIIDSIGRIVPAIGVLLPKVGQVAKTVNMSSEFFTYEMFAGQIEDRTRPCSSLEELKAALIINKEVMGKAAHLLNLSLSYAEIVAEDTIVSLEVNPFSERHQQIWRDIPHVRKVAASVVAAVHVHLSVGEDEIVKLLNRCTKRVMDGLVDLGDHSGLQRINAYRTMAQIDGVPPTFSSFSELMNYIASKGGEKNVWDLVRYKPSTKTVEFRMFGTTSSNSEIIGYVEACLEVVK